MRKNINLTVFLFISIFTISCGKEDFNYPEGYVGSSKITTYANLTLTGDRYIVLGVGEPYNEPGATAKEGESDLDVSTSGSVNVNVPGIYTLTYSAVNADGFPASIRRTVIVADIAADAAANDLSGDYLRAATGEVATWTKIAPGVYTVLNPGGASGTNVTVVVINPSGYQIDFPEQVASDGGVFSGTDISYNSSTGNYTWTIINPGYGTAPRSFVKQ